jgi:hypothetical protein
MKEILLHFVIIFVLTLVVGSIVNFLWNLIFHGTGMIDWETPFRLAIIFGIVLSWMRARERKEKAK